MAGRERALSAKGEQADFGRVILNWSIVQCGEAGEGEMFQAARRVLEMSTKSLMRDLAKRKKLSA